MRTIHNACKRRVSGIIRCMLFCSMLTLVACTPTLPQSAEVVAPTEPSQASAPQPSAEAEPTAAPQPSAEAEPTAAPQPSAEAEPTAAPQPSAEPIVNEFTGAYYLQSMFLGDQQCLDANYEDANPSIIGAYMAPCDNSSDQTWQFTPIEPYHYQIWFQLNGEQFCLDGNDPSSEIHNGAAFAEPCRLIAGQVWTLTEKENGMRLHTEYRQHSACLESNSVDGSYLSGASFMANCEGGGSGQNWRLIPVNVPSS